MTMTLPNSVYGGFGKRVRPAGSARRFLEPLPERIRQRIAFANTYASLPYVGITADGRVEPGLFPLQPTGVSTKPVVAAGNAFLDTLSAAEQSQIIHAVDAPEWRKWLNAETYAIRHGIGFEQMRPPQVEAALNLLQASLSVRGYEITRTVMKLNQFLGDICNDHENLGEWLYWLAIYGTPSATEPWGWQIDGHHLNVSCLFVGDQMALSPAFLGAEPSYADRGPLEGLRIFEEEERNGLELVRALSRGQQDRAILYRSTRWEELPLERTHRADGRHVGGAFHDNIILPYEGLPGAEMTPGQRQLLLSLIETYVGRLRAGHDQAKMEEVKAHLDRTHLLWMGGIDDLSPFYYRVHSPVTLIEFDHHHGVFLDNYEPERFHIHTIVRTPNGNDYGKNLLRQHLARHHQPTTPDEP